MPLNTGYLQSDTTATGDERYTPEYAVSILLEFISPHSTIWCPFDMEDSAYYSVLNRGGHNIILTGDEDFFSIEPVKCDFIITNPPFSKKNEVLKRLYELKIPFAILLPISALQAASRFNLFYKNGLQLLVPDKRVDFWFDKEHTVCAGRSPFASAYFCYKFLPTDLIFRPFTEYKILKNKQKE